MNKKFSVYIDSKINKFNKTITVENDKSISHRALLIASQCIGVSKIKGILESEDVKNTIVCLKKLGVKIVKKQNKYFVYGNGLESFRKPSKNFLYAGNSGTLARMLIALLSTHKDLKVKVTGDSSLSKRDMKRIIEPLSKIGCNFYPKNRTTLPLTVEGTSMPLAQKHFEKIGSAQVKSSIMLSALNTPGITTIIEEKKSRNHTENLLTAIKADIKILKKMKANIKVKNIKKKSGELVGDIYVKSSDLKPINCPKRLVPSAIDEFPLLFCIASIVNGTSKFSGISELRHKESDRIKSMESGLNKIGIKTAASNNTLKIFGKPNIKIKNTLKIFSKKDHRIAMSFFCLGQLLNGKILIHNFETVNTSFSKFLTIMKKIGARYEIKK